MEVILHGRQLYCENLSRKLFITEQQRAVVKNNIQHLITIGIRELPSTALFTNGWLLEILKSSLKQAVDNDLDVRVVEQAFKALEKYFLHLVQEPWKKEFREIKMYGGFYRTRVKSIIPDCEQIFERAGYMIIPEKCTMVYRGSMDKIFLPLLAFDCRVSQIECRVIAEDYCRTKDLSLTLSDVVDNILNDGYSLHEAVLRRSLAQKQARTEGIKVIVNASVPPVIPKRQPVFDVSTLRHGVNLQDLKLQNVLSNPSDDHKLDLGQIKWKQDILQNPPKWPTSMNSFYLSNPPLPAGTMSEPLAYIDNTANERIPELPMGTSEDHIQESLKLVNRRGPLKPQDYKQDSKNTPGLNPSQIGTLPPSSARGYQTGNSLAKSYQPSSFADEGIDMLMSKPFLSSSKFGSAGVQQAPSHKNVFNTNPGFFSSGYGTGNPPSSYQSSSGLTYNIPQTIYHPPSTKPVLSGKMPLSRQYAVPCQVPSEVLDPSNPELGLVKTNMYSASGFPYTASQLAAVRPDTQKGAQFAVQPSKSVPGYLPNPQLLTMEQVLSKHRPAVYKTSSLKTDTSSSLSKAVVAARAARSMDIAGLWECPSCTKLNTYPETICSACSQIYVGADLQWHEFNKSQAMY